MQNWVGRLRETLALLLVVAITPAFAQGQPYPTLKGNNSRTGNNGATVTANPGVGNLNWFAPKDSEADRGNTTVVDNLDSGASFTTNWIAPVAGTEAPGAYWHGIGAQYLYASCVKAYIDNTGLIDNTRAMNDTGLEVATFTLQPKNASGVNDNTARDFGVYLHFPDGPTTVGGTQLFQMGYQVVKITPSGGPSFVDIVNVAALGKGWVRLGNGGMSTAKLFHYDGTTPITVSLYNTIPRDGTGNLLDKRDPSTLAVYADAAEVSSDLGSYTASPTVFQLSPTDGRVVSALNANGQDVLGNSTVQGVVYSRDYKTGQLQWKWSPPFAGTTGGSGSTGLTVDNQDPSVSADSVFTSDTSGTPGSFLGADYFSATITNDSTASGAVGYSPTLDNGSYNIYFHTVKGGTFGRFVGVDITEDGGLTFDHQIIDQTLAGPWVQIGSRRYNNVNSTVGAVTSSSLQVYISNYSADATDAGKTAYADALRFDGTISGGINSTPVQAKVFLRQTTNSIPVLTNVVLVATEQGVLYCLDAAGDTVNKTTKVYWTYPSSTSPDPNQVAGKDGVGPLNTAPTLFNTSSALIQSTQPPVYNGGTTYHYEDWVQKSGLYYISMTEPNTGVDPASDGGHTHWAPVSDPGDSTHAQDRLFIGSSNGRVYSIDMTGRGDFTSTTPGSTARVWTYPDDYPATVQNSALGPFKCSLAYSAATDNTGALVGTIYASTAQGRVYALDATGDISTRTTSLHWTYPALTDPFLGPITSTPAIAFGNLYVGTAMGNNGADPGKFLCIKTDSSAGATPDWGTMVWSFNGDSDAAADNFFGGPAIATAADLNGVLGTSMPNTVFVANQNRYIYAFDAGTGTLQWKTKETNAGVQGPLAFTCLTVPYYDTSTMSYNSTPTNSIPTVMVPTENGHIVGLYANTTLNNRLGNGTRRNFEYDMAGATVSGPACGYDYMYTVDQTGYLYAFNTLAGSFGGTGTPPGSPVVIENNPQYDRYATGKVKLITEAGYQALRSGSGNFTTLDTDGYKPTLSTYEYGETIYAAVYNYPNDLLASDGTTPVSITANFNMSVEGSTLSSVSSNSQTIAGAPYSATVAHDLDGLSLLTFTLDEAGSFSLPPGNGVMQVTLQSAYNGLSQPYSLNNQEGQGEKSFSIANPLAIYIDGSNQIGNSTDRTTAENLINGNGTKQIDASAGAVAHGQSGLSDIAVIDRSLMTLKRGPGLGLNNIRIQRGDLNWKYAGSPTSSIVNPLPSWAANFEDLPVNLPNTSKDYPDIRRDRVTATKDPNGSPQNPLFNGVDLIPPPSVDDSSIAAANGRTLQNTPFRLAVEVPKYQPANYVGYKGPMIVFVDSTQTGTFDITSTKRSAYRTLNLGTVVTADKRLKLGQSVIDLKSLSGGAGMSSSGIPAPYDMPGLYQAMDVYNMGNVNLLNVRLAHGTSGRTGGDGTAFGSSTADGYAWLDSHVHLLSDLDPNIWDPAVNTALGISVAKPFAVKPRVGDRQPAKMSVNPRSRVNPGTALFSNANWPAGASPQVTMRIPLGFPAGSYAHSIRVIEDDAAADALLDFSGVTPTEAFSDPTAILKFKVAETRLTNGQSLYNLPAIDNPTPAIPAGAPNAFKNKQPTGMRTPVGDLVVAWISDRSTPVNPSDTSYSDSTPTYTPSPAYPGGAILNPKDRLYLAGVQGSASTVAAASYNNSLSFSSPLSDLTNFVSGTQWFSYRSGSDPFPKDDNQAKDMLLPDGLPTGTHIDFQMHHPSLPTLGEVSPVDGSTFSKAWLAVVGDARFQLAGGNQNVSRIILAPVTSSSGVPSLDSAHAGYIDADDASPKGKPSVVQLTDDHVIVFYASGSGGQSHLNYATVDTSAGYVTGTHKFAVSASTAIDLPAGFELAGSPSVVYRNNAYYDIAFVGKLSGRPNAEVFMIRLPVDPVHGNIPSSANGLFPFPLRVGESLLNEGGGTFRAKGVGWQLATGFALVDGATGATLIDTATQTIDPTSGVVSYKSSRLGGQVYLNTHDGTVRFTSNAPLQKMDVRLSYQPTVIRLSNPASAGHAGVSLVYDNHQVTSGLYWMDVSSNSAQTVSPPPSITSGRFVVTYNRAASGAGQAARPYWKTLRQGVQLSHSIYVNPATGLAASISITPVTGTLTGYYQYDPVKGRVYFSDNAGSVPLEGVPAPVTVSVTYTALDQTTGQPLGSPLIEQLTIGLIDEQDEAAIPIDVPVNENGLATFFDPMSFSTRPSLYWMLWSSARGNGADLFMQTVSPNFVPTVGQ